MPGLNRLLADDRPPEHLVGRYKSLYAPAGPVDVRFYLWPGSGFVYLAKRNSTRALAGFRRSKDEIQERVVRHQHT